MVVDEDRIFKKTLTYLFLYPLLRDIIPQYKTPGSDIDFLRNCFLYDESISTFKYRFDSGKIINQHIILATLNKRTDKILEWKNKVKAHENYVTSYLSSDALIEFIVIEFPKEYSNSYFNFLHGNYSLFSDVSKKIILDFHKGKTFFDIIDGTLNKKESLRLQWLQKENISIPKENEYWYKPSLIYKSDNEFPTGEVLTEQIKKLILNGAIKT